MKNDDSFVCPHCGAVLAVDATFCRSCGASDEIGWESDWWEHETTGYTDEEDFDYEEYVSREHGFRWNLKKTLIAIVVLLICAAIFLLQVGW